MSHCDQCAVHRASCGNQELKICLSADKRFRFRFIPLSALKHLLFHSHELCYLWPCVKWTLSGHAACLCLCFCFCRVADGSQYGTALPVQMWQHITAGRSGNSQEHVDLRPPSLSANELTLTSFRGPGGTVTVLPDIIFVTAAFRQTYEESRPPLWGLSINCSVE